MDATAPRMLVVAHGTASAGGRSTVGSLVAAARLARPGHVVDLCYLDVLRPTLADALRSLTSQQTCPTVVVPALLSTGYHVLADIPAEVAPFAGVRVARHLGPHPLLTEALLDRLGTTGAAATVLVAAGSSRPEAATEVRAQADLLAARLGHPVTTATVADDLGAAFAALPAPFQVATYLLAEGMFTSRIHRAAGKGVPVGAALGAHPAVVDLLWLRYDEARRAAGVR